MSDDAMINQLRRVVIDAEYAIRHASGETKHPTSDRPFDYEDFQVWANTWLIEARAALEDKS